MKPVFQTDLTAEHGNCYSACIASILEIPLENVPNISDYIWNIKMAEFIAKYGYNLLILPMEYLKYFSRIEGTYCIVSAKSPRHDNILHAVVGIGRNVEMDGEYINEVYLVHNPFPNGELLNSPYIDASFFVKIGDLAN